LKNRVFLADAKSGKVEVLGVKLDAEPRQIRLLVNGSDLIETLDLERIEIVVDKEEALIPVEAE
jgi:hypothetical protein